MASGHYLNPYEGTTILEFFGQLIVRLGYFLTGSLSIQDLASDEIQVIVLICVAISSSLVGAFLVLRRMTMLANSLSHTILIGIIFAFLLTRNGFLESQGHASINITSMLIAALITGIITTFLTEFLTKVARLQEDASTGLVFTSLFALGIVAVTILTRSSHIGAEVVMGNVDALQLSDCKLIIFILLMNILLFSLFYKEYLLTTFDPNLSNALGISANVFNYLLMVQVSATVLGAFRAVGVIMVLSFITGPVLTARLIAHRLSSLIKISILLGCIASILGVGISRHILSVYGIALSTGGIVVCTILALFITTLAVSRNHVKKQSLSENS